MDHLKGQEMLGSFLKNIKVFSPPLVVGPRQRDKNSISASAALATGSKMERDIF